MVPSFLESAMPSKQSRQADGKSVKVVANNIAVEHMVHVYRHPLQENRFFRNAAWLCFWLFSLCFLLFFGDLILHIAGLPWAWWWLLPAWVCSLISISIFVVLNLFGYLYSHGKIGTPLFWKDRCLQSVQGIRKKHPEVVAYLEQQPMHNLPWWWLFHPSKRVWVAQLLTAIRTVSLWILLAETAFWGWYGVSKDVLHRPYLDTLVVLMTLVELICIVGVHRLLVIEFSAWTGATNKAYLTFSQAVLRQDIGY